MDAPGPRNLPPMKFIPLAEETGLIIPIGRWVLRTACAQNMAWQHQGLPAIAMAVNLSPRQFLDDSLLQDIDDVLRDTGMSPTLLQLEITESMVMQNVERAIKLLDEIQGRGIRLAIDDFGTGYSSMSLMRQFPIDTIKIDGSFVRDLERNAEDRAMQGAGVDCRCGGGRDDRTGCVFAGTRPRRTSGLFVQQTRAPGRYPNASSPPHLFPIASTAGPSIARRCKARDGGTLPGQNELYRPRPRAADR